MKRTGCPVSGVVVHLACQGRWVSVPLTPRAAPVWPAIKPGAAPAGNPIAGSRRDKRPGTFWKSPAAVVLDAGRRDLPESQPPARPSCTAVDLKPNQSGFTVAKGEWIGSRIQPEIGKIRNIFLNKARIAASIGPKGTIQPQKRRGASERPCDPL